MKVSVILPTYNEADNIIDLILAIKMSIPVDWTHEIIVVDDNSPDQTFKIVQTQFLDDPTILPIERFTDRGLGKAIRAGIEVASGEQLLVMDTDFTHNPKEIPSLLYVGKMFDLVSGSRFCTGGNMHDQKHYLASLAYNIMMRLYLRTQVQDNLGGFWTAKRQTINKLPFDSIFYGYGDYYFRLLYFAKAEKLSIVEIPSIYQERKSGKSKSNFVKMLFLYTTAMIRTKRDYREIIARRVV